MHVQRIQFAKEKSHAIEKLDGTFRPRQKNKRQREEDEEDEPKLPSKRARPADKPAEAAAAVPALPAVQAVPTNKLLVQNLPALPAEMLSAFLKELFGRFPGLQEVRPVEARRLAFVEYSSESSALPALQALHNYVYDGTNALAVTFA